MDPGTFEPLHLSWLDVLARIGATIVLSLALGLERFVRKKPVDFRPFVIIALGACALMIGISEYAYLADDESLSIDPAKVISGTMTGIGFIGAGALFREEHTVYGAGSAASILAAGAIGLVCGMGFVWLAGLLTLGLVLTLVLSRPFTDEYTIRIEEEEEDSNKRDKG